MRKALLALLMVIPGISSGENMCDTHGYNYTYTPTSGVRESQCIFPILWDARSAPDLLDTWERLYHPGVPSPFLSILEESRNSGFNAVILRSGLGDTWFPEIPGSTGDDFFPRAHQTRALGLHLFPGGIETDLDSGEHNQAVMDYLELYIEMTAGQYPGDVIGMFCFDEPDVKYLDDPGLQTDWLSFISYWSQQSRSRLGLKSMSYLSKFGTPDADGNIEYYSDTTCVLNRIGRFTDMICMDSYPAKNNFRRTDLLEMEHSGALYVSATDLVQEHQMYLEALTGKDEILRVIPEGDSARVLIDLVSWDGIDLHAEPYFEFTLPFIPDGFASSDFRSGVVSYEGSSCVNSGVLIWNSQLSVDEVLIIRPMDGIPVVRHLPGFTGSREYTPVLASVGQTDFWADRTDMTGVIGRGRLAVAVVIRDRNDQDYLQLYISSGPDLQPVFTEPRVLHYPFTGALWGTFWGTWYEFGTIQPVARNGFILYDQNGSYITLHQLGRDYWQLFPAYGTSRYDSLFGGREAPEFVRVTRVDGDYPPFFAGRDLLTGFFSDTHEIFTSMSMYGGGPLTERETISVTGLPGDVTGFELFRNDHRYSDRPLFTTSAGEVFSGAGSIETGTESGSIQVEPVRYCSGDAIEVPLRPMYTRDAIRSALVRTDEGYYMPHSELYSDVMDHVRFQWYPNVHRTGMETGVKQTARENVSFAVIQSWGRHGFALPTYCVSPDTMLYMVTSPVVEGCRGLVFYALDLAMMSGNGGDDGLGRAPWVLQNWGPSRDTENRDMIGIIHGVVSDLTGRGNGNTDYLDILVDPRWTVLDRERAFNADPADSLLNFIVLENPEADTVVVIAVNNATSVSPFTPGIVIEDLPAAFDIVESLGWEPFGPVQVVDPGGGSTTLMDYTGIPPLTASLTTLTRHGSSQCEGTWLQTATNPGGETVVTFSLCHMEQGTLVLHDLAGRKVSEIWSGEGGETPYTLTLTRGSFPAGMYFAVLRSGDSVQTGKCILW